MGYSHSQPVSRAYSITSAETSCQQQEFAYFHKKKLGVDLIAMPRKSVSITFFPIK